MWFLAAERKSLLDAPAALKGPLKLTRDPPVGEFVL